MALYDVPLTLDGGVVRETTELDTVPASVLWGRCKNISGTTLTKGTPVYTTSSTAFTPEVLAADASNAAKMPAIGLLDQDLADGAEGAVVYLGFIQNIALDPVTYAVGDHLYVASGGGYTKTRPTGSGVIVQFLGTVTRAHLTNGGAQITGTGQEAEYPAAGIAVSTNGNQWGTSLTAPAGDLVGTTATQTLTNKRVNPRVSSASSVSLNFYPNSDNFDVYAATAQNVDFTVYADTGTPVNGQKLIFRFKDDGGQARPITWTGGVSKGWRAIGVTLPTSTTLNKTVYIGCIYNAADDRWDAVAIAEEA